MIHQAEWFQSLVSPGLSLQFSGVCQNAVPSSAVLSQLDHSIDAYAASR